MAGESTLLEILKATGAVGGIGTGSFLTSGNSLSYTTESISPTVSKYNINKRTFPADLTDDDTYHNHAMLINISVNNQHTDPTPLPGTQSDQDYLNYVKTTKTDTAGKLDYIRQNTGIGAGGGGLVANVINSISRTRTRRIQEAILLYMPNILQYETRNDYHDVSLTSLFSGGVLDTSGNLNRTTQLASGAGFNPRIEVYYRTTALRTFQFEFLFNPSSEAESESVKNIINTLRYHAAPEETSIAIPGLSIANSLLWLAPSLFDITFFHNMNENTKIPRISTCVLEAIDVDVAPTGVWSTFRNGYPVTQRVTLRFKEMNIMSKKLIASGF